MTAPEIPGFYYDEQKKKYFRIQANHIAPSSAKYSQSNVKHEQHRAKRQKSDHAHASVLRSQTVLPAPVLRNRLLGGSGLHREISLRPYDRSLAHRELALLGAFRSNAKRPHTPYAVLDAHWAGSDVLALIGINAVFTYKAEHNRTERHKPVNLAFHDHNNFRTLGGRIVSSSLSFSDVSLLVGCSNGDSTRDNAFITRIDGTRQHTSHEWTVNDTLVECATNEMHAYAFVGEKTISTGSSSMGQASSFFNLESNISGCAVEWLNNHTLAYGTCERHKKYPSKHTVMLWDVRSAAHASTTAARFVRPERITGITKPDTSGLHLIVTSNYEISMYDLRLLKADRPLLSIPHVSEGRTTHHSTHNGSMLAAIDRHQDIQTYSWRTGKHIKTISSRPYNGAPVTSVRWFESHDGPFLQACTSSTVLSWAMGGVSES